MTQKSPTPLDIGRTDNHPAEIRAKNTLKQLSIHFTGCSERLEWVTTDLALGVYQPSYDLISEWTKKDRSFYLTALRSKIWWIKYILSWPLLKGTDTEGLDFEYSENSNNNFVLKSLKHACNVIWLDLITIV